MAIDTFTEGKIPFDAPNAAGQPAETWYKIVGDLDSPTPPLIVLHGGPGAGHHYLVSLTDLYEKYKIPILFYDQVGCGNSTHFRARKGDTSFWTFELYYAELDNLIDHFKLREKGFFLLGHSWGGVLAGAYASRTPSPVGLRKLVNVSGPASTPLYLEGCRRLIAQLPQDVRETLEACNRRGDHESSEYEQAAAVFSRRHACHLDPYPEPVASAYANMKDDPTAYLTILGPSKFVMAGTLKTWEGWKEAHKIKADVLLLWALR
ncbi:hypothetical protein VTH82DRAFT_5207 [Thermothelomyces myriococcoides]